MMHIRPIVIVSAVFITMPVVSLCIFDFIYRTYILPLAVISRTPD